MFSWGLFTVSESEPSWRGKWQQAGIHGTGAVAKILYPNQQVGGGERETGPCYGSCNLKASDIPSTTRPHLILLQTVLLTRDQAFKYMKLRESFSFSFKPPQATARMSWLCEQNLTWLPRTICGARENLHKLVDTGKKKTPQPLTYEECLAP